MQDRTTPVNTRSKISTPDSQPGANSSSASSPATSLSSWSGRSQWLTSIRWPRSVRQKWSVRTTGPRSAARPQGGSARSSSGRLRRYLLGCALQPGEIGDHLNSVAELRVAWQVARPEPPGVPGFRGQPDRLANPAGDLLEGVQPGVVAVAPPVPEHDQRRAAIERC